MRDIQISFCTVCMNRLHHLKETLPQNIENNSTYKNLQFVLLDYNSRDGLEEWVKNNMHTHLVTGRLKYYRTTDPCFFHPSHSKNVVFKLADGEVICNIDADNYTGNNFASYVNEEFNIDLNIFLTPINFHKIERKFHPPSDTFGRICLTKKAFLDIKGYSEKMSTTGFQDYDLANRLELAGNKRVLIDTPAFLSAISHDDVERLNNEFRNTNLEGIYYSFVSPGESVVIFLYNNGSFEKGTIRDNSVYGSGNYYYAFTKREYEYGYSLKENNWVKGTWKLTASNKVELTYSNNAKSLFHLNNSTIPVSYAGKLSFLKLNDLSMKKDLIKFNTHYTNRTFMLKNWVNKRVVTNRGKFGSAAIAKSFTNYK